MRICLDVQKIGVPHLLNDAPSDLRTVKYDSDISSPLKWMLEDRIKYWNEDGLSAAVEFGKRGRRNPRCAEVR